MALNIKDVETDVLAREVAALANESITEAIKTALTERKVRLQQKRKPGGLVEELLEIGRRLSKEPVDDPRTPDEILGYDENGLPS